MSIPTLIDDLRNIILSCGSEKKPVKWLISADLAPKYASLMTGSIGDVDQWDLQGVTLMGIQVSLAPMGSLNILELITESLIIPHHPYEDDGEW